MIVTNPPLTDYHYEKEFNDFLAKDRNTCVIVLHSATFELAIPELILALKAVNGQTIDGVILYLFGESPPVSFWRTASNIVRQCYHIDRVAVADHGMSIEDPYFKHIPFTFLRLFKDEVVIPARDRKYSFCSLNRQARPDRIRLVNRFKQDNILQDGIVSLGSDGVAYPYHEILDADFARQMPLLIDNLGSDRERASYKSIPEVVKQSIVNVIAEGTAIQVGIHTVEDTVIRPLISEKTTKAFACNQLPIWLATPGFVAHIRVRGFDVFDDLIDHSYDSELHTVKRIEMIAHEVKKLVDMGIDPLREFLQKNWARLEHNRQHRFHVAGENEKDAEQRIRRLYRR
jgi:hypothetical protein